MPEPMERSEGRENLAKVAAQGAPRKKRGRRADPKASWQQMNVRIDAVVKHRLKAEAENLKVPFEEVVNFGLEYFVGCLDSGEIDLPQPVPANVRMTILESV